MNQYTTKVEKILLLEPESAARGQLASALEVSGVEAIPVATTQEAFQFIKRRGVPHLAVVDWQTGHTFCRQIRQWVDLPLVVLTDVTHRPHIAEIIENGADDCLTKPYSVAELTARVRRVLRRVFDFSYVSQAVFNNQERPLNLTTHELTVGEHSYRLTPTETKILAVLIRHSGQFVPTQTLLKTVWPSANTPITDSRLHIHMHRIRNKFNSSPNKQIHLQSNHSQQAYKLDMDTANI